MSFSTIISTEELADRLGDPSIVVVDVRSSLADAGYGERAFALGHIPGAVYADLNRDLSDPPGGGRGRHPLPDVETIASTFGGIGISRESQVVAYDDADGMYASRLWWMLRYVGHERVAVLDGGFAKWVLEGRAVTTESVVHEPVPFHAEPNPWMLATADEVDSMRLDRRRLLIDSRSPDRYRGENETIDPVAGHIPGALNRPFTENIAADGRFKPAQLLRAEFQALLQGRPAATVVHQCGSGVSALPNLLAMEVAGLGPTALFAGSWSEWCSDPQRPVERG